jgi:hypothetical protein
MSIDSVQLGSLNVLESGGALKGSVFAVNLGATGARASDQRRGINVRGPIEAPIAIRVNVDIADIIGSVFRAPIDIGWNTKGSIIAYGVPTPAEPDLGTFQSIRIGFAEVVPTVIRQDFPAGFVGLDAGPMNTNPRLGVAAGEPDRTPEQIWFGAESRNGIDKGALDCTIYGRHAQSIELKRMTPVYTTYFPLKNRKPRIEVERIEALTIERMENGVVWSGKLEYSSADPTVVSNDPSNDYASIGAMNIECLSPAADIYFKDTPLAVLGTTNTIFEPFDTTLGELHLPQLRANEAIRIRQKFGAVVPPVPNSLGDLACNSLPSAVSVFVPWFFTISDESSPRGRDVRPGFVGVPFGEPDDREPAIAPRSLIRIADPEGLKGQITVFSNNVETAQFAEGVAWGQVRLGADRVRPEPLHTVMAIDAVDELYRLPLYKRMSSVLGGGAVGLVPYAQAVHESLPTDTTGRFVYRGSVNDGNIPIKIQYYGQVTGATTATVQLFKLNTATPPAFVAVSPTRYSVSIDPTSLATRRSILVRGSTDTSLALEQGTYRLDVTSGVKCDLGLIPNPAVIPTSITFELTDRCTNGGYPYPADIANDAAQPIHNAVVAPDPLVPNNGVTEGDYNLFFSTYFDSPPGPWCDIAYDSGAPLLPALPSPEVNNGVTEADYNLFFATYFEACAI